MEITILSQRASGSRSHSGTAAKRVTIEGSGVDQGGPRDDQTVEVGAVSEVISADGRYRSRYGDGGEGNT